MSWWTQTGLYPKSVPVEWAIRDNKSPSSILLGNNTKISRFVPWAHSHWAGGTFPALPVGSLPTTESEGEGKTLLPAGDVAQPLSPDNPGHTANHSSLWKLPEGACFQNHADTLPKALLHSCQICTDPFRGSFYPCLWNAPVNTTASEVLSSVSVQPSQEGCFHALWCWRGCMFRDEDVATRSLKSQRYRLRNMLASGCKEKTYT